MLEPQYRFLFAEIKTKVNLQQKDIANDLGFKPQTMSNWVSGRSYPRMVEAFELVKHLSKVLGREIKVDDLYKWIEK